MTPELLDQLERAAARRAEHDWMPVDVVHVRDLVSAARRLAVEGRHGQLVIDAVVATRDAAHREIARLRRFLRLIETSDCDGRHHGPDILSPVSGNLSCTHIIAAEAQVPPTKEPA